MRKDWSDVNNRVIGHVVWSPPITGLNAPDSPGYTQDVCVIKLDKRKFLPNFQGNVIDLGAYLCLIKLSQFEPFLFLGTEIDAGKFMDLLSPQLDVPSEFDYPEDRLYQLKAILAATIAAAT